MRVIVSIFIAFCAAFLTKDQVVQHSWFIVKVIGFVIAFGFGYVGYGIGERIRNALMPDYVIANGVRELAQQRIFWAIAFQAGGCLLGAIVGNMIWFGIAGPSKATIAREDQEARAANSANQPKVPPALVASPTVQPAPSPTLAVRTSDASAGSPPNIDDEASDPAATGDEVDASGPVPVPTSYSSYKNAKFGYTLCVPNTAHLKRDNSIGGSMDGATFIDGHGLTVQTYGSFNTLDQSVSQFMATIRSDEESVTSKTVRPHWQVEVGGENEESFWRKVWLNGDQFIVMIISFKAENLNQYSPVVQHLSDCFKPGKSSW